GRLVDVNAAGSATEVRTASGINGRTPRPRTPRRWYPIELVSGRNMLGGAGGAWPLHDHDARAIGGPDGGVVEGGVRRQANGPAPAIGPDLVHRAACIGPGHIGEPLTIRRPCRHLLLHTVVRQPPRRAVRQIHDVEAVQGAEREPP